MPTRILREGIITSERVNALSDPAELFYRRAMSILDDYGRFYAHPSLLRASCYPLKLDKVSEADVKRMLSECVAKDLILLYGSGKYIQMVNFRQQTRSPSKFPEPTKDELLSICKANANHLCSESESESESLNAIDTQRECSSTKLSLPKNAEEVIEWGKFDGVPEDRCREFYDHYEAMAWVDGNGHQIFNARRKLAGWRAKDQEKAFKAKTNGEADAKPDYWKDKSRFDLVTSEIKAIEDGSGRDAMGTMYIPDQTRSKYADLVKQRRELKAKLGIG